MSTGDILTWVRAFMDLFNLTNSIMAFIIIVSALGIYGWFFGRPGRD